MATDLRLSSLSNSPSVSKLSFCNPFWIVKTLHYSEHDVERKPDETLLSSINLSELLHVVVYESEEVEDENDQENRRCAVVWCRKFIGFWKALCAVSCVGKTVCKDFTNFLLCLAALLIWFALALLVLVLGLLPVLFLGLVYVCLFVAWVVLYPVFQGNEIITASGRKWLVLCLYGAIACTGALCFTGYQDDLVDIHNENSNQGIYELVSILTLTMGALNDFISFLLYFFFIFSSRSFASSKFTLTNKHVIPSFLWPLPIKWVLAPNITEPANNNTKDEKYSYSSSNFIAQGMLNSCDCLCYCFKKLALLYDKDSLHYSTRFPTQMICSFRLILFLSLGTFLGFNYSRTDFTNTINFPLELEFVFDLVYMLCWGILTSVVMGHYIGCLSAISLNIKKNSEDSLKSIRNSLKDLEKPDANKAALIPNWFDSTQILRKDWQSNCMEVVFYNNLTQRNMVLPLVICISTFAFSIIYIVSRILVKGTLDSSTLVLFATNFFYVLSVLWMFKEAADITHSLEVWGREIKKCARTMFVNGCVPVTELGHYNIIQAALDTDIHDSGIKVLGFRIGRKVVWFMILNGVSQLGGAGIALYQLIVKY